MFSWNRFKTSKLFLLWAHVFLFLLQWFPHSTRLHWLHIRSSGELCWSTNIYKHKISYSCWFFYCWNNRVNLTPVKLVPAHQLLPELVSQDTVNFAESFPPDFCAGPDVGTHQKDHHENSPCLLSNGHSHRGQHGHRHGSKYDVYTFSFLGLLDCLLFLFPHWHTLMYCHLPANRWHRLYPP